MDRLTRRTWLAGAISAAAELPAAGVPADPLSWTLIEASAALARKAVSSEELTRLCLARIAKLDRQLHAFLNLDAESALAQARDCDRRRASGRVAGKLHGIPIALKDNIDTASV